SWTSKKYMNTVRAEYYDRKNKLLKVAVFQEYKSYRVDKKTFWRPHVISMTNLQTRKKSIMKWSNRNLGVTESKSKFTKRGLKG
ncbi:outer membrane lipoprotein-sorting protein, partial [Bacteriovoracaceae bacterium]|nr:outer membrane lipoprotein-sorting protein [Bacteriovoracaceae bacterium]